MKSVQTVKPRVSPLGLRIKQRVDELGLRFVDLEENIGVRKDHIWDVASGKKHSLKMPVLEQLAAALGTTEMWLLQGRGPQQTSAPRSTPQIGNVRSVEPSRETLVRLSSLDMETGSCALYIGSEKRPGIIVDPALRVGDNRYVTSMASMKPVAVTLKNVILNDDSTIAVILDAKEK